MPGSVLALTAALATAAGESSFQDWLSAEAAREDLTVTTVGTLPSADGERLPYAQVETPQGTTMVVEVAGARWVLGPFSDGTELLRGQLAVRQPSKVARVHELFFEFRSGAPVIAREHFSAPTGEWDFDYVRLTRTSPKGTVSILPVLPPDDESTKLVVGLGEVIAHDSQLWLRSRGLGRWQPSWLQSPLDASRDWIRQYVPNGSPFGVPLEITLLAPDGARASKSFLILRFDPPGRWRPATPWIRKVENGRIGKLPP